MVIKSMNSDVAVTLTEEGARVLNARRCAVEQVYREGDTYTAQFHHLVLDFGGEKRIGEQLPFKDFRPVVRVTAPSRRI